VLDSSATLIKVGRAGRDPPGARSATFDNLSQHRIGGTSRAWRSSPVATSISGGFADVATGGQIIADAAARASWTMPRAWMSGAVGVQVSMEQQCPGQGAGQRTARCPWTTATGGKLTSSEVWVDRRRLVHVPAGTGGYEGERWYAAGSLLKWGLPRQPGHSIGEWAAQGGTVLLGGRKWSRRGLTDQPCRRQPGCAERRGQAELVRGVDGQSTALMMRRRRCCSMACTAA
jgi:hypothetical protein